MGHAVGAPLELEVGVEGDEEVVVLVWKCPFFLVSGLGPSVLDRVVRCCCQQLAHPRWVGICLGAPPSAVVVAAC